MTVLAPIVLFMLVLSAFVTRGNNELRDFDRAATMPLRGWLAIAVVLGHLDTAMGCPIPSLRYFHWEGPAVSVFFFMSGYGYARSAREKSSYATGFLKRTCLKLFVPFTVCSIISLSLFGMLHEFSSIKQGEIPFLLHSWFVFGLMFLSVSFIVLFRITRNRISWFFVCSLWLVTVMLYVVFRCFLRWPSWWYCSLGAFPFGTTFYMIESTIKRWITDTAHRITFYLLTAFLWILVSFLAATVSQDIPFLPDIPRMLLGANIALVLYIIPIRIGAFLGAISYEIYLSHGLFEMLLLTLRHHPIIYVLCVLLCTLAFSWLLKQFINKVSLMKGIYVKR